MPDTATIVLDNAQIEQKINRIAYQVYENNFEEKEIIFAGIDANGYVLAQRLAKIISDISPVKATLAKVEINKQNPLADPVKVSLPREALDNKAVIVVDDVLNSGKTLIYGVNYFLQTPVKYIRTVVLVDRSHKSYPVKADYVGLSLATTMQEHILVEFNGNGNDRAYLK